MVVVSGSGFQDTLKVGVYYYWIMFVTWHPQNKTSNSGPKACPHFIWEYSPRPEMYSIKKKLSRKVQIASLSLPKTFVNKDKKCIYPSNSAHFRSQLSWVNPYLYCPWVFKETQKCITKFDQYLCLCTQIITCFLLNSEINYTW